MTDDQIQITYEEQISSLPRAIEQELKITILRLLKELGKVQCNLSLFFCSVETMIQLNGTYRNNDKATDLLSWLYSEDDTDAVVSEEPWGELVYCLTVIDKQAAASGWELKDELLRLTVHGLVHLLGYDHESDAEEAEMLGIEKKLLELIGLADVYPA